MSDIPLECGPCLEILESNVSAAVGRLLAITPEGVLIGRGGGAALQLDDDRLSSEHVRVSALPGGEIRLVDLGSTNGTYVNGARVDRATLRVGDRIRIGHTVIQYVRDLRHAQRVSELLTNARIALWDWEIESGRFTTSHNFAEVTGLSVKELIRHPDAALEVIHPEDRGRAVSAVKALRAGTDLAEIDLRLRGSGSYDLWLGVRAHAVRAESGLIITGSATNITARKWSERELRRVTRVLENLHDAIVVTDLDGRITDWTAKAQVMFSPRKRGRPLSQLGQLIGEKRVGEIQRAIAGGGHWTGEVPIVLSAGAEGIFEAATAPLKDDDGWVVGTITALRDVTARNGLQNQLILADKLAAIGSIAAGVAHEINNPLAVVTGGLEWIAERFHSLPPSLAWTAHDVAILEDVLAEMKDGAARIAAIVAGMKNATQKDDPAGTNQVPLRRAVEGAARILANEVRHSAKLVVAVPDDLWVACSETRLMQVFIHLIANAVHAIEDRGSGENEIRVEVTARGPDRVAVALRDTGVGMSPETLGRLFTPFFSTKPPGRGTGLGLSVARTILETCGGRIHFESRPGEGTTAHIELPIVPAPLPAAPIPAPELPGKRGLVLVIDDEPFVANALSRLLRSRGFQTEVVTDGRAGLDKLLEGQFRAVVCDLMMPEFSGVDLYQELEATRPDLLPRLIFLSGGAFTPRAEQFVLEAKRPVLSKPWNERLLMAALEAIE